MNDIKKLPYDYFIPGYSIKINEIIDAINSLNKIAESIDSLKELTESINTLKASLQKEKPEEPIMIHMTKKHYDKDLEGHYLAGVLVSIKDMANLSPIKINYPPSCPYIYHCGSPRLINERNCGTIFI